MTIHMSVKGVVVIGGQVLLLRNARGEWELPGGRPNPGESPAATLEREVREEANVEVKAADRLDDWLYEVLPSRFVRIVAYGCDVIDASAPALSEEHEDLRWFAPGDLDALNLHEGYRRVIDRWFLRAIR